MRLMASRSDNVVAIPIRYKILTVNRRSEMQTSEFYLYFLSLKPSYMRVESGLDRWSDRSRIPVKLNDLNMMVAKVVGRYGTAQA